MERGYFYYFSFTIKAPHYCDASHLLYFSLFEEYNRQVPRENIYSDTGNSKGGKDCIWLNLCHELPSEIA